MIFTVEINKMILRYWALLITLETNKMLEPVTVIKHMAKEYGTKKCDLCSHLRDDTQGSMDLYWI